MPNYRYNTPDRTRRNNYGRQAANATSNSCTTGCRNASMDNDYHIDDNCCMDNHRRVMRERSMNCDSCTDDARLCDLALAMAYVPMQKWGNLYKSEEAFMIGTIFEDLNKPFRGAGGCSNGR